MLHLQPLSRDEAQIFIAQYHRHHGRVAGDKFRIGLNDGERVVGVIVVGRPVARMLDDGYTAEVTRCCVMEGVKNGASKLYAAAWRAARAMGYTRLITYTLASEPGTSLKAAGWTEVYRTEDRDRSWSTPSRPRVDKHPLGQKILWDMGEGDR
jgi:hypothetical protein